MNDDIISVVIPAYNSAETLEKCVKSITDSEYRFLQIIIVENGSTDNTLEIATKLKNADDRIEVYSSDKGVSKARNFALKKIKGKYVTFVDSDDYVYSKYFLTLYNDLVDNNADLSVVGLKTEPEDDENNLQVIDNLKAMQFFIEGSLDGYVWGKLFKSELLENLKFDEKLLICEDRKFLLDYLVKIRKITINDAKLYFYFQREDSVTNETFSVKWYDLVLESAYDLHMIEKYYPQLKKTATDKVVKDNIRFAISCIFNGIEIENKKKNIVKTVQKYKKSIFSKNIIFKHKVYMFAMFFGWDAFAFVFKITKRSK
ncbi:MAG: glycosyltransferase family 2 protein [Clostridia bacterium]